MRRTTQSILLAGTLVCGLSPRMALAATPASVPAPAPASGPRATPASQEEVNDLIRKGHEAMRGNRFREAIDFFDRARTLTADSPRTIGEVGFAEQGLGDWISSESHLRSALAHPDDPWVKQHQGVLEDSLKVVQKHIGELVVTGPASSVVSLDGRNIGRLPIEPVRLVDGSYKVALKPSQTEAMCSPERDVQIAAGKRVDVELGCTQKPVEAGKAGKPVVSVPTTPSPAEPQPVLLDTSSSRAFHFGAHEWAALGVGALGTGGAVAVTLGALFIHDQGVDRDKGPWFIGAGAIGLVAAGALGYYCLTYDDAPSRSAVTATLEGVVIRF